MCWKTSDDANFYGSKMSRLAFCDEILMSMKKNRFASFRGCFKMDLGSSYFETSNTNKTLAGDSFRRRETHCDDCNKLTVMTVTSNGRH